MESESTPGKERSVLTTLRIPEPLLDSLRNEAKVSGITLNAFVNQIIRQYLEWQIPATESGFISMHRDIIRAMAANMGDEKLSLVGREDIPNWIEHLAMSWYQSTGPDAILKTLVKRFEGNRLVRLELHSDGGNYRIVVRHDLGPNWSRILEAGLREVVTRYVHAEPLSREGKSMVTVTFKANPGLLESKGNLPLF